MASAATTKSPDPPQIVCSVCGASFGTVEAYERHMVRAHQIQNQVASLGSTVDAAIKNMAAYYDAHGIVSQIEPTLPELMDALRKAELAPIPEELLKARYTPTDVFKHKRGVAGNIQSAVLANKGGAGLAALIPFVDADKAISFPLETPWWQASISMATAFFNSHFEYGQRPYIQRYWQKEYLPNLPSYQDMIGIYVREGYLEDHQVEIPTKFVDNMKELGYAEEWTRQLWGKHWVLPGVELLYDMFHKEIIDYETLALMLKFHDFLPEWRGCLIENAYQMIPRVDLRRAYMYGRLTYKDLVTRYGKLGYGLGDEILMADIAQRFALEAHYSRLLTVARAAYRKGQLPGPDFQAVMEEIHVPPAAQDLILKAETLARQTGTKDVGEEPYIPSRIDMRWLVEWGQVPPEDLPGLLEADGMDPEWAAPVAEAWLLNQLRDELAKVRRVYEDKLEAGFMSKATFAKELEGLHYPPHIVNTLVKWAEEALDLEEKKELAKEYEALAKDEVITVDEYGAALRGLKMVEGMITRKMKHMERLLAIKAAKEAAKKKG